MDGNLMFPEAVERWIAFQATRWCERTTSNVRRIFDRLIASVGSIRVAEFVDVHVEDFFLDLRPQAGWALYVGAYLRGFCRWLQRRGAIQTDPSLAWPRLQYEPTQRFRVLTREEEALILPMLSDPIRRFVVIALGTGLRRGTIYAALWGWVDSDWCLSVPASAIKQRKSLLIPLGLKVRQALGDRGPSDAPLLPDLPHRGGMSRSLRMAAVRAGLDPRGLTVHQLRKTWVARARDGGATREEVQLLQGWSSSNVLLEHYWPRLPASRAAQIMESI